MRSNLPIMGTRDGLTTEIHVRALRVISPRKTVSVLPHFSFRQFGPF
jgi:hypothetical protein